MNTPGDPQDKELEDILQLYFVEITDKATPTSGATDRAKESLEAWKNTAIQKDQEERIIRNKSFCGCPMCIHHTSAYEAQEEMEKLTKEDL